MVRIDHCGGLAAIAALCLATPVLAQERPVEADAAPMPPAGAAATFALPARDEAGYLTPNRHLSAEETIWHVRVALNVAALGCRGSEEGQTAAAYNAVLQTEQAPLAAANTAMQAQYQARHGAAWQARYDEDMTRLYNFFAQPPAHDDFCTTAKALLRESAAVAPSAFAAFAGAALVRLEAPFQAFFAAFEGYQAQLAAWRARHAPVVIATAAVAPVAPVAATIAQAP